MSLGTILSLATLDEIALEVGEWRFEWSRHSTAPPYRLWRVWGPDDGGGTNGTCVFGLVGYNFKSIAEMRVSIAQWLERCGHDDHQLHDLPRVHVLLDALEESGLF